MLDKAVEFILIPKKLAKFCKSHGVDKIICRSSMAGALGYLLWKKIKLPYIVESFEPHAQYMVESQVWSKWGIRYNLQSHFEKQQKKTAKKIITVSANYRDHLLGKEISCPVEYLPCTVNIEKFSFIHEGRISIRNELGIDEKCIVGIYVGKFGGIYYDQKAFNFFKLLKSSIKEFFLIILTPDSASAVSKKLDSLKITGYWVGKVEHEKVPEYLSAADLAFCPVKPSPSRKFCSPIKNGEYWVNGLPILISQGIGDDSDIILNYGGGIIVDYEAPEFKELEPVMSMIEESNKNRKHNRNTFIANAFRSDAKVSTIINSYFCK